jgi:hypothetical protein
LISYTKGVADINRTFRGVFGPEENEITEKRRALHNRVLHNLCCSPNMIMVTESRRTKWAWRRRQLPMGVMSAAYELLVENPERNK